MTWLSKLLISLPTANKHFVDAVSQSEIPCTMSQVCFSTSPSSGVI